MIGNLMGVLFSTARRNDLAQKENEETENLLANQAGPRDPVAGKRSELNLKRYQTEESARNVSQQSSQKGLDQDLKSFGTFGSLTA